MKVMNVIICDEVRRESNGKHIIIGVYPNDILVAESDFPSVIPLTIWAQLDLDDPKHKLEYEFRTTLNDTELFRANASAGVDGPNMLATIVLMKLPIPLSGAGILKFQIREIGKRWKLLKPLGVRLKPDPQ